MLRLALVSELVTDKRILIGNGYIPILGLLFNFQNSMFTFNDLGFEHVFAGGDNRYFCGAIATLAPYKMILTTNNKGSIIAIEQSCFPLSHKK